MLGYLILEFQFTYIPKQGIEQTLASRDSSSSAAKSMLGGYVAEFSRIRTLVAFCERRIDIDFRSMSKLNQLYK